MGVLLSSGEKKSMEPETSKTVRGLQNQRVTRIQMSLHVDVFFFSFQVLPTGIFTAISRKGQKHNLFPLAWYCVRLLWNMCPLEKSCCAWLCACITRASFLPLRTEAHLLGEAENSTGRALRVTSITALILHTAQCARCVPPLPSPDNEVIMRLPCPKHLSKQSQSWQESTAVCV